MAKKVKTFGKNIKKSRVNVGTSAHIHIFTSFNNIIMSLTNLKGEVVSWSSAGKMKFKGAKKNTPYAAQMVADDCVKKALDLSISKVKVFVRGPGVGRESAIRSIYSLGLEITEIVDVTPLPHNGCRPPKRRRA